MLLDDQETPEISQTGELSGLLEKHFGFRSFRPGQEEVCQTVVDGHDVLVVMPTGAGKSLCYQIPAIARGGLCLVVSPLVALIEDQVRKLQSLGLKAERIHSGRTREESRQVCQRYLEENLDFLYIAPERLSVPGFIEFLARNPPSLIAIDEAHCISQWGHDFRPDYRTLGERLNELRPVPVIALTATATPTVQNDICRQLRFQNERRVIQGFRRKNIAISIVELSPATRPDAILEILKRKDRLPAIVYAPTRKKAEELTKVFQTAFRASPYHAGLSPELREDTQIKFLEGELDVIVATIAFGMGIDKPNIRTVIHAALPGNVEGFYQEIGRAGRDGLPSEAYLLYSYADQITHDFFFDKNYPETTALKAIYSRLEEQPQPRVWAQQVLQNLDEETFDRALEQLWVHRGVQIDADENLTRGDPRWQKSYEQQRELRRNQLQHMVRFTRSGKCRMLSLITHFGDQNDSKEVCGICDVCVPSRQGSLTKMRKLSEQELEWAKKIVLALGSAHGVSAGKLFQTLAASQIPRSEFEKLLLVLEKNGALISEDAQFEKDGKTIAYRRITLTQTRRSERFFDSLEIPATSAGPKRAKKKTKLTASSSPQPSDRKLLAKDPLFEAFRVWRLERAKGKGVPAFCVLSDRVLLALCEHRPQSRSSLLEISGISQKIYEQYGDDILQILAESPSAQ